MKKNFKEYLEEQKEGIKVHINDINKKWLEDHNIKYFTYINIKYPLTKIKEYMKFTAKRILAYDEKGKIGELNKNQDKKYFTYTKYKKIK